MEEVGDLLAVESLGDEFRQSAEFHPFERVFDEEAVFFQVRAEHAEVLEVAVVRHGSPFAMDEAMLEERFEIAFGVGGVVGYRDERVVFQEAESGLVRLDGVFAASFVEFLFKEEIGSERIGYHKGCVNGGKGNFPP